MYLYSCYCHASVWHNFILQSFLYIIAIYLELICWRSFPIGSLKVLVVLCAWRWANAWLALRCGGRCPIVKRIKVQVVCVFLSAGMWLMLIERNVPREWAAARSIRCLICVLFLLSPAAGWATSSTTWPPSRSILEVRGSNVACSTSPSRLSWTRR